jgi:hypothetical protein
MLGTRWIESTRKNQVKNTSGQKLQTTIIKLRTAIMGFALWFALIKNVKIADHNSKISDRNFRGWKREHAVLKRFSHWNYDFLTPLRPRHLSTDWRIDPKQERRERTQS